MWHREPQDGCSLITWPLEKGTAGIVFFLNVAMELVEIHGENVDNVYQKRCANFWQWSLVSGILYLVEDQPMQTLGYIVYSVGIETLEPKFMVVQHSGW